MNSLYALIAEIKSSEEYQEIIRLKSNILDNPRLLNAYNALLLTQKKLVHAEVSGNTIKIHELRNQYDLQLDTLQYDFTVEAYLHNLDEFTNIIHEISEIINFGLNEFESKS